MINTVTLQGRVVKDCVLLETKNGKPYTEGTLAVNEYYKQGSGWNEKTHYIDFSIFGLRADQVVRRLKKGVLVTLQGQLNYRTWQRDDAREAKVYVNVQQIETHGGADDKELPDYYEEVKSGIV